MTALWPCSVARLQLILLGLYDVLDLCRRHVIQHVELVEDVFPADVDFLLRHVDPRAFQTLP